MLTMPSQQALPNRQVSKSPANGAPRWRTDYFGTVGGGKVTQDPQAFLIEMPVNDTILPHFHVVDQFQVFVSGAGKVGRSDVLLPLTIHYADRFTGYGPIDAGPQGYSYFTLRANTDSGPVYLHQPGYREKLQPSKKRHFSAHAAISTEAVLANRDSVTSERVNEKTTEYTDGLDAKLFRAGKNMSIVCDDPAQTGGQYFLIVNGSLTHEGQHLAKWSVMFVHPTDAPLSVQSGQEGCELLMLQFGKQ
jgi:hypothetical protein